MLKKSAACSLIATSLIYGPMGLSQSSSSRPVSPREMRDLLRQPDGLERLSAVIGDVTLYEPNERWGEGRHDLGSLILESDCIVVVSLPQGVSRLSETGDTLKTEYTLLPSQILKGKPQEEVVVTVGGGSMTLPNGHSVTVHTPIWDDLAKGTTYLLFLRRSGKNYEPTGSLQGILRISSDSNQVHILDTEAQPESPLSAQLKGLSLALVEDQVRERIAANSGK